MRRREFIAGLGSVAAWPLAARAQQVTTPVIGYLGARSSETDVAMLAAVRRGLAEIGYAEGRNVAIEYRFADGQYDRLPALAMDLTNRHVAVIIYTGANDSPENAVYRTLRASNIPIVFNAGTDPVLAGFVASFNHPGGSITGVYGMVGALTAKHLGLLHDLVPNAKTIAVLTDASIAAAFATIVEQRAGALLMSAGAFSPAVLDQIISLAARHAVPTLFPNRERVVSGGLASYGAPQSYLFHQMGVYTGRILKGEKPADLPVQTPNKYELVINLKTAKALGLTIPETLLATADEVIQ